MIAAATLTDVVNQRTEHQQVRTRDPRCESTCICSCFDEVPIDGPGMDSITRWQIPDRAPLRQQSPPQTGAIESFDDRHRPRTRPQQHQKIVDRVLGHGSRNSGALSAKRLSVDAEIGIPPVAAAAATRMINLDPSWAGHRAPAPLLRHARRHPRPEDDAPAGAVAATTRAWAKSFRQYGFRRPPNS